VTRTAIVIAALIALIGALPAQAQPASTPAPPQALAIVNGRIVTEAELWWYMSQMAGGELLDGLILSRLLAEEAETRGVKVGEPEVDAALERVRAEHGGEEGFTRWLRASGRTLKGLRMALQQDLLIDKLLEQRMGLTDAGIREYYEAHPDEFTDPPRILLADIVTLTLDDAFTARERLAGGADFAAVARELSRDPTAAAGGDRGWITPDDVLEPRVAEVVFALSAGQISDPVDCGDHYHIFLARAVEPAQLIPFEEARPRVVERIRAVRGISREELLSLLKCRARIEVLWPDHRYLNDVYADLRAYKVAMDGRLLSLPAAPRLLPGGNLIIPAQAVLEAMGAEVTWTPESGVLEATRDGRRIRLVAGVATFAAGDRELTMSEAPRVEDGVLMIAPRGPIEALGGSLMWNRADNTLYVTSRPQATEDEG
jgi:hypothetical protein